MKNIEFPPNFDIQTNISLADYTTLKIGGPADFLSEVRDQNIFISLYRFCRDRGIPFLALGHGTNVFFPESGFRGLVAIIRFDKVSTVTGSAVVAEAGASLDQIRLECIEHGLSGFEFASGIPGSIGGAVYGNAGASHPGWTGEICEQGFFQIRLSSLGLENTSGICATGRAATD